MIKTLTGEVLLNRSLVLLIPFPVHRDPSLVPVIRYLVLSDQGIVVAFDEAAMVTKWYLYWTLRESQEQKRRQTSNLLPTLSHYY